MPTVPEEFLLQLLQACAALAPQPLYPSRYAREANLDRALLDEGLDELRRRGLIQLTEWVKDLGQGCALTEAGKQALASRHLSTAPATADREAPHMDGITDYERGEIIRASILNPCTPYATRILLVANLLYFAYGILFAAQHNRDVEDNLVLIELGAIHPNLVFPRIDDADQRPQFERIILFSFVHIGWLHLIMNMYFLFSLGPFIEGIWGTYRFAAIYAVAGIVSGCMILQLDIWQQKAGLTAGASGALYGTFASLVVWFVLNQKYMPPAFIAVMSKNLGINLILLTAINFVGGVSWKGHLGGAIGGLLAALVLHLQRFHPTQSVRFLALLAVPMIPVAFFLMMLRQAGWI